jgi:adenine deaminase
MVIACDPALRRRLVAVAQEQEAPDLLVRRARLWNAFTGEIGVGDIAICADRIAKVGPWSGPLAPATATVEAKDRIAVPGYIEPHTHPWPFANPLTLGEAALCRGTTCLVYDELLLHLALGAERLRALTAALSAAAVPHIFWVARIGSQSYFEAEERVFAPAVIARLLQEAHFIGTAEMTRWTDLLDPQRSARLLAVLESSRRTGKFNEGHTAGASPRRLGALANAGIRSCHEAVNAEEALERLRLGLWTLLRHSSLREDLPGLIACLKATSFHDRLAYTTDGTGESYLQDHGLTDHLIRIALDSGVPPNVAYRLATLNPAVYLGLDEDLGAVAPGRIADVNLLRALDEPTPELVICRGRVAAREGALVVPAPSETFPWAESYADAAPFIPEWGAEVFLLPRNAPNPFPAARLINAAITRESPVELAPKGPGQWPRDEDALVLTATNRGGEWITRGVVRNIGGKLAAVATTYTTNAGILILGRSPEAMAEALLRLRRRHGGITMRSTDGEWSEFALPMAGIHRVGGFAEAAQTARDFQQAFSRCGYPHSDAKYTLLFLTADMLPEVRATEAGWVRIKTGEALFPSEAVRRTFKADHGVDTLQNLTA